MMKDDTISRAAAVELAMCYCPDDDGTCSKSGEDLRDLLDDLENLPSAQSELEDKIRAIGYTGKEGRIYIGGRLFAVRELPQ